ncbi:LamG domain-containing protein, partial [Lishizhenia sp.]|uniref:LamG domain-containing protein n=1 Tax=Lishizhenia sp. TaxID=2497594 RepID=UPI00299D55E8
MKRIITSVFACLTLGAFAQNTALNFDGVDDYVKTSNAGISGDGARTIEAWINTTNNSLPGGQGGNGQAVIVDWGQYGGSSYYNGKRFTFNTLFNNSIRVEVAGSGLSATTPVNDGQWHHVACTFDPNDNDTVRLFIDGVEDAKGRITIVNTGTTHAITIGKRIDDVSYFSGDIDEVKVWDFAKTEAEIAAGMNAEECSQSTSGLVAYFPLNEGVAGNDNSGVSTIFDLSTNEGHSTDFSLDLTTSASNYVTGPAITAGMEIDVTSATSCGDYVWSADNATYTTSGVYKVVLSNTSGCDSIVSLDLTVLGADATTETVTACNTYTWATNGQTYTTSGQYTANLTNINGCDSIVTLDLTIGVPTSGTDVITACDSYTWIDGVTYT